MNDTEFLDYLKQEAWSFYPGERLGLEESNRLVAMVGDRGRGSASHDYTVPCMLLKTYIKWAEHEAKRIALARLLI